MDSMENGKISNCVITIISVPAQNSDWPQINRIDVIEKADKLDLTYIIHQDNKNMIKELIRGYKIHKVKEISVELNVVL